MDLVRQLQDEMPRFNSSICDGLATEQLRPAVTEEYIDIVIKSAAKNFPEGFRYQGFTRCTPEQQFRALCQLSGLERKGKYEASYSDIYMVCYRFEYGSKVWYKYLMLPNVHRGGILSIRGAKFHISPALIDNLFSIEDGNIFVQLTRTRINFSKLQTSYLANGTSVKEDVVWSKLHNWPDKDCVKRRHTLLANYLFASMGVTETFKRYFDTKVHYGIENITEENYPSDKWVICESDGNPTTRTKKLAMTMKTHFRIAVPKDKFEEDAGLRSMIGSFFYILDHISDLGFVTTEYMDKPRLWRRVLARFIYRVIDSESQKLEKMDEHMESVRNYMDSLVLKKLRFENIHLESIEDFLAYLIKNFTRLENSKDLPNTIGKQLETTRFVLFDITRQIFNMMYKMQELKGARLTEHALDNVLNRFPTDHIMKINSKHGEVSTLETASDSFLMKVTLPVVDQEKASNTKKGSQKSDEMKNPKFQLHPSNFHTFSYLSILKSAPSGHGRLNPFASLGENYDVRENEVIKPLADNFAELAPHE